MKKFDVHHHLSIVDDSIGMPTIDGMLDEKSINEKADHHRRVMERYDICGAALMPAGSYPDPNGVADTRSVNDQVAWICDENSEWFPVGFGTVEPSHGEAGLHEIDRLMTDLDLDGVMWHHRWQGAYANAPVTFDYVERAATHDAVVLLHAIRGSALTAPWRIFDVTTSFPDVKFVVLDAFSSKDQSRRALHHRLHMNLENVYFDISLAPDLANQIEPFVEQLGADRLLFGTDVYTYRDDPFSTLLLEQIGAADLTDSEKEAIFYENAARLFDL